MTATSPKPQVVVLAAGASARLGQPKALAPLPLGTPLQRLCAAGAPWSSGPVCVVSGAHHAPMQDALPSSACLLHHPGWARGRTGSVQAAIQANPAKDLLIAPVDCPRIPSAVFAALVQAWWDAGSPSAGWLAPHYARNPQSAVRYGHPILIGHALAKAALGLAPSDPLRVLRSHAKPLLGVPVPHPEILEDLDTPEDLAQLVQRDRERL